MFISPLRTDYKELFHISIHNLDYWLKCEGETRELNSCLTLGAEQTGSIPGVMTRGRFLICLKDDLPPDYGPWDLWHTMLLFPLQGNYPAILEGICRIVQPLF